MAGEDSNIESVIAEAVKVKVQAMMVDALGEPGELVRALVHEALTLPVETDRYGRGQPEPLIKKIARDAITEEAKAVMRQFIDDQRDAIRAELARRLVADKREIAETLIASLVSVAKSQYSITVKFTERADD